MDLGTIPDASCKFPQKGDSIIPQPFWLRITTQGAAIQFGRPFEDALFGTTWLGDIKYQDINNDGVIDNDDRTVIGNPHPDFTFGFQNSLSYKNFDLSVFLQGSYGNDIFNAVDRTLTAANLYYVNQSPSVLDYLAGVVKGP